MNEWQRNFPNGISKETEKEMEQQENQVRHVRDTGAAESELTGCKGLWFRDKFVKSVSSARAPQSLQTSFLSSNQSWNASFYLLLV